MDIHISGGDVWVRLEKGDKLNVNGTHTTIDQLHFYDKRSDNGVILEGAHEQLVGFAEKILESHRLKTT